MGEGGEYGSRRVEGGGLGEKEGRGGRHEEIRFA